MRTHHAVKGYTLIELAIVMLVTGVVMASAMSAYSIYAKQQRVQNTRITNEELTSAMSSFLLENGRYPCPAAIDLEIDNPKYGMEADCPNLKGWTAAGAASATVATGAFDGGIWVEQKVGDASVKVVRGMVPFRALNLPEEKAYDRFGNRFFYAVTRDLASAETYKYNGGGISVKDADPAAAAMEKIHFVVYSAGENALGAYTKYGKLTKACSGAGKDIENCDRATDAVYMAAQTSLGDNADRFDDFMSFSSTTETPFWRVASDPLNINDVGQAETLIVGIDPAAVTAIPDHTKVYVGYNMRAYDALQDATNSAGRTVRVADRTPAGEGNILAEQFCDEDGGNCLTTDLFNNGATPHPNMDCDSSGKVMDGVASNTANCVDPNTLVPAACGSGTYMAGINSDGNPVCLPYSPPPVPTVPLCPRKTVSICGASQDLPSGAANGQRQTLTGGFDFAAEYRCNADANDHYTDWQWELQSERGTCACADSSSVETRTCNSAMGGGYWSGNATRTRTETCDAATGTRNVTYTPWDTSACLCTNSGRTRTRTNSCLSGQTGIITYTDTWTCTSPTTGSWSGYVQTGNTCTCQTGTDTRTINCPSGQLGSVTETRTSTCASPAATPVWGPWTQTASNCTPCVTSSETRTQNCPNGQTGGPINQQRDFRCPQGTWSGWYTVSNTCVTPCSARTETRNLGCPSGQTGVYTQERTLSCPANTWSSWTDVTNTCVPVTPPPPPACTPYSDTENSACPAGYRGQVVTPVNYVCNASGNLVVGSRGAPDYSGCSPITYRWQSQGSHSSTTNPGIGYAVGSSCTTAGATGQCYVNISGGGGAAKNYSNCICQ